MWLVDWFKSRRMKREAKKMSKAASEPPELQELDFNEAEIVPPESRFTDEYREFLERREEAAGNHVCEKS